MHLRVRSKWTIAAMGVCALLLFGQARPSDLRAGPGIHGPAVSATTSPDPGPILPFNDIAAGAVTGVTTVTLSGIPALTQPRYLATTLSPPDTTMMQLGVDPDPSTLYASPTAPGRQFTVMQNPSYLGIDSSIDAPVFIVEVAKSDAPATTLYVGIDSNGNGQPEQSEQVCQANVTAASSSVARCVVDLRAANQANSPGQHNANVWVLVDVPQGAAGATYSISLASNFPNLSFVLTGNSRNSQFVVTGPGHVSAQASFPLRLAWGQTTNSKLLVAGQRYLGAVLIEATPGYDTAVLPFALTYAGGNDDLPVALGGTLNAGDAESFHYLYVDVPLGTDTLQIDSVLSSSDSSASAVMGLARADFPGFSPSAGIAPAPATGTGPTWSLTASAPTQSTTISVTPGRWYVNVQTSSAAQFTLIPQLTYNGAASEGISPGAYYNPQRSGHGAFLSQGGGQQVMYWYTYLEDGTPTWYMAQAPLPSPAGAVWHALLLRANWDGLKVNSSTVVGAVTLARIDASDFMFSWTLDGQSGSERFTRLGAGACPSFDGAATNFNGAWYVPAQSGYGMDVLALPNQLFSTFYFYDALGIARWGVGTASPFASADTIQLVQSSGFCPACEYRKITTQPLGTMTVGYSAATSGSLSANLMLQPPLSGSWTVDQQTLARLTGSPSACTQ